MSSQQMIRRHFFMESHIFTPIIQFVRAKLIICCIGGVFLLFLFTRLGRWLSDSSP